MEENMRYCQSFFVILSFVLFTITCKEPVSTNNNTTSPVGTYITSITGSDTAILDLTQNNICFYTTIVLGYISTDIGTFLYDDASVTCNFEIDGNMPLTRNGEDLVLGTGSSAIVFKKSTNLVFTDTRAVELAKNALVVTYATGDNAGSVTSNVVLTNTGPLGTSISWTSNNNSRITNTGVVSRPLVGSGDASVSLTAVISKGSVSDSKSFNLTVKAMTSTLTDAQAVAAAKSALIITYSSGDNANSVTNNVVLTKSGLNGTSISWATNNSSRITNAGVVSRPSAGSSDVSVTLTATISKGNANDSKSFNLTVKAMTVTNPVVGNYIGTLDIATVTVEMDLNLKSDNTYSLVLKSDGVTDQTSYGTYNYDTYTVTTTSSQGDKGYFNRNGSNLEYDIDADNTIILKKQ